MRVPAREPEEAPGSQLQISQAPPTVAIWGTNQQMEDLSLSVSSPLCSSDFYAYVNSQQIKHTYRKGS